MHRAAYLSVSLRTAPLPRVSGAVLHREASITVSEAIQKLPTEHRPVRRSEERTSTVRHAAIELALGIDTAPTITCRDVKPPFPLPQSL